MSRTEAKRRFSLTKMKTTSKVSFKVSAEDDKLLVAVVNRAILAYPDHFDRLTLSMDLTACHANGCELDLDKLLGFDPFNFAHDIFGIVKRVDRRSGHLTDCFSPRCSK